MELIKICKRVCHLAIVVFCLTANVSDTFATVIQNRIELADGEHLRQFNNDGSAIITCGSSSLNFYDVNTGKKKSMLLEKGHQCLSVSRDSKLLATVKLIINDPTAKYGHDTIFYFWDITGISPRLLQKVKTKDGGAGQFSPDDSWFVDDGTDSFFLIWDVASGNLVKKIDLHHGRVESISLSPDGKLFAISGYDGVQLWEADKWKRLRTLPNLGGSVLFSPDGKYLANSIDGKSFNLWDVNKNKWHWPSPAVGLYLYAFAFSSDSKLVAFAGEEITYLYKVDAGKLLQEFPKSASAIAFSPDGKHLVLSIYEELAGMKRNVLYLYASPDGSAVFE